MNQMKTIDLKPIEFIDLEPAEFIECFKKKKSRFRSFKIIAPQLGSPGFGKIRAVLEMPIYGIGSLDE